MSAASAPRKTGFRHKTGLRESDKQQPLSNQELRQTGALDPRPASTKNTCNAEKLELGPERASSGGRMTPTVNGSTAGQAANIKLRRSRPGRSTVRPESRQGHQDPGDERRRECDGEKQVHTWGIRDAAIRVRLRQLISEGKGSRYREQNWVS
ncbi:hypothetical protein TREES_T100004949 [Tupaia chinensis]|uniref:Uncharacterized protein n=1 Tax=Tupaia chinensis TaxID=246437 RepID=L9LDA8_TUPCH|nr:hypothetical protein TREES_T100004949 [Tupaia chinensis]